MSWLWNTHVALYTFRYKSSGQRGSCFDKLCFVSLKKIKGDVGEGANNPLHHTE